MAVTEAWRTGFLDPWKEAGLNPFSHEVTRFVYQHQEMEWADSLPHVVKPLPNRRNPYGLDSPHQTGEHTPYDILTRAPLCSMTSHMSDIRPHAPTRGMHRHLGAPALFCVRGGGWEWNDGVTYQFSAHDLLVVPPYTIHQHGGDEDLGCEIYVPQPTRVSYLLGSLGSRELHELSSEPTFLEGTDPIRDAEGKLTGFRIRKGVLGLEEDLVVTFGADPDIAGAFEARQATPPWQGPLTSVYDRYLKLFCDEVELCKSVPHVIVDADQPWESTRHGRLKWLVHPETYCAAKRSWIYLQDIAPSSRSGKHWHVAEELIYVLEGQGYDLHDDVRWNWEKGDLICIPPMTSHQHFNTGDQAAVLMSAMTSTYTHLGLGGIVHLEDAPPEADA